MKQQHKYRAYLCCGRNCGPKGAENLLVQLESLVEDLGIGALVSVSATGCQNHCDTGPTMVIYPGPIYYMEMSADKLERIAREHFLGGQPVEEFFWSDLGASVKRTSWSPSVIKPAQTFPQPKSQSPPRPVRKPSPPPVDDLKW